MTVNEVKKKKECSSLSRFMRALIPYFDREPDLFLVRIDAAEKVFRNLIFASAHLMVKIAERRCGRKEPEKNLAGRIE